MTIDDRTLVARIKELVPHYDETTLGEEFPGLTKAQFSRCYVRAAYETDAWRRGSGGAP